MLSSSESDDSDADVFNASGADDFLTIQETVQIENQDKDKAAGGNSEEVVNDVDGENAGDIDLFFTSNASRKESAVMRKLGLLKPAEGPQSEDSQPEKQNTVLSDPLAEKVRAAERAAEEEERRLAIETTAPTYSSVEGETDARIRQTILALHRQQHAARMARMTESHTVPSPTEQMFNVDDDTQEEDNTTAEERRKRKQKEIEAARLKRVLKRVRPLPGKGDASAPLEEHISGPAVAISVKCADGKEMHFKMGTTDEMSKLYAAVAAKGRRKVEQVVLMFDGEKVQPTTTPQALDMEDDDVVDAILHGDPLPEPQEEDSGPKLKINVQTANGKTMPFLIGPEQPFSKLYEAVAAKLNVPLSAVVLSLDGERVGVNTTPESHELEDDDVLDAMIVSK